MKNMYRLCDRHKRESSSKSNNSPMGIPHPASSHSWKCHSSSVQGHASNERESPATALNLLFHKNSKKRLDGLTPIFSGFSVLYFSFNRSFFSSAIVSYWRIYPLLTTSISPSLKLSSDKPWCAKTSRSSSNGI